jgi:hypothetical protein
MPRKKPYTYEIIMKQPCWRCGKPSFYQWQICSDSNIYRPLCPECDIGMQHLVLDYMGVDPHRKARLISGYERRVARQLVRYGYPIDVPSLGYELEVDNDGIRWHGCLHRM